MLGKRGGTRDRIGKKQKSLCWGSYRFWFWTWHCLDMRWDAGTADTRSAGMRRGRSCKGKSVL